MGEDGSLTDKILRLNSMENQAAFKQKLPISGIPQRLENISAMVHAGARRKSEEEARKQRELVEAIRESGKDSNPSLSAFRIDEGGRSAVNDGRGRCPPSPPGIFLGMERNDLLAGG